MDSKERIKIAFDRNAKALSLRPTLGTGTAVTRVRLREGLTCDIEDGEWKLTADMGEKSGGNNQGPNPGVLGRGALGSCLAMSDAQWAAQLGVPVSRVEVEIQADYDARGHYAVADVTPAFTEVRYVVTVESEAPEADIMKLVDQADAHTPYHAVFSQPQTLRREVRVVAPKG